METLEKKMDNLTLEIRKGFNAVNTRFCKADQCFGNIDTRFDKVDQRFDNINTRLDGVDRHIEKLKLENEKLARMSAREFMGINKQLRLISDTLKVSDPVLSS